MRLVQTCLISLTVCLVVCISTIEISAQTGRVYISSVTGAFSDQELSAAAGLHTITISWEGTGITGQVLTTNCFLIHGSANWQAITTRRRELVLRTFGDAETGALHFLVTLEHMGWHKVGGSGDPNFGAPGSALKEPNPPFPAVRPLTAGPHAGNGTGTDTVGIFLGLTSTGSGWEPAINTMGEVLAIDFFTSVADDGKTICIDTVSYPLGAWEWSSTTSGIIRPEWNNGFCNGDTRCWTVLTVPNCIGCPITDDNMSYSNNNGISGACCCVGVVGDAAGDGNNEPSVADIAAIVDNLFGSGLSLPCVAEADADKSGGASPTSNDISVGDISRIIDHLFGSGDPMANCS